MNGLIMRASGESCELGGSDEPASSGANIGRVDYKLKVSIRVASTAESAHEGQVGYFEHELARWAHAHDPPVVIEHVHFFIRIEYEHTDRRGVEDVEVVKPHYRVRARQRNLAPGSPG
jgi:hypothetical protein